MGSENIWLPVLGGFSAFIANVLYCVGGTKFGKRGYLWIRRYLSSFILALSANVIALNLGAWNWKYIMMFPALFLGFSFPYSSKSFWIKIIKRTFFAFGVLSASFVGFWASGFSQEGLIIMFCAVVTGLCSILLGVFNPYVNAPLEQFLICQLLTMFIPFWGFVK
jgi:hypothetical protein